MYRHHHSFIPTCVLFLFALQSYIVQANIEPFTVTFNGPRAGLLGTTVQFSVSPSAGAGGYTYQWTIADVDQGITANQSYLVPNTPAEVTVKCKVTDKDGSSLTPQITFWQVNIELDSLNGADYIGDQGSVRIYATQRGDSSSVTVTLKKTPSDAALPANFITWTGGTPGSDQLQRNFSPSTLQESGVELHANVGTPVVFNSKMYVFPAKEWSDNAPIIGDFTKEHDPGRSTQGNFGMAWLGTTPYDVDFYIYYEDGKWRFWLSDDSFDSFWNVDSLGRTDIPADTYAWPYFPSSSQTPILVGYINMRIEAKTDFTPDGNGHARKHWYWCEWITETHENYHIDDWYENYLLDGIMTARERIESDRFVVVTLDKLDPNDVLEKKQQELLVALQERIGSAMGAYQEGYETRAYGHCALLYQSLADSIRIQE